MRLRVTIISIIVFLVLVAFVISGCSQLSAKESTVDKRFSDLVPELSARYRAVENALDIAEEVGGERDVTVDGQKALSDYRKATEDKNLNGQLQSARKIEVIIGRLHANASASPRLKDSQELDNALVVVNDALPARDVRQRYDEAVQQYERARTSWRNSASAFMGGFSSAQKIAFWTLPE